MKKRLLSMLLALVLVLTMLPMSVLAEELPTEPTVSTEPAEPSESTEPAEPSESTEPTEPTESVVPEDPSDELLAELLDRMIAVECPDDDHGWLIFDVIEDTLEPVVYTDEAEQVLCAVRVNADAYVEAYNDALDLDVDHVRSTKEEVVVDLVYDTEDASWSLLSDDVIVINVRCEEPEIFYTIYAEAGKHGTVSNEGWPVYVEAGDDMTIWFYPDKGYEVSAVYVDGYPVGYYGICYDHYWECDGCEDCWWVDWSKWFDCDDPWCDHWYDCDDWHDHWYDCDGWCGHWYVDCDWYDWQDCITFYDVDADHEVYVEFAPVDSGCPSDYYYDLNTDAWYHEATDFVIANDIMEGVGGKYFDPNGTTTRGQLVTMLYRLAGEPKVSGESEFLDVADGKWYTDAVIWAAKKGIVDGYGNGYFGVFDTVTREQTVTILYRYAKYMGISVSKLADLAYFVDAELVSDYAEEPFGWAVKRDIIEGKTVSGGALKLDPQGATARVEMAAMLMRFAEYVD